MTNQEKKTAVLQDLKALSDLGITNAKKTILSVKSGKYDSDISDFGGGRIDQLSDLLIYLEEIK